MQTQGLNIGRSGNKPFHLPLEFLTRTQSILAIKGGGKTYTALVEMEELLDAGQQCVAIDPTGVWWGLRSSADGKAAGLSHSSDANRARFHGSYLADQKRRGRWEQSPRMTHFLARRRFFFRQSRQGMNHEDQDRPEACPNQAGEHRL